MQNDLLKKKIVFKKFQMILLKMILNEWFQFIYLQNILFKWFNSKFKKYIFTLIVSKEFIKNNIYKKKKNE